MGAEQSTEATPEPKTGGKEVKFAETEGQGETIETQQAEPEPVVKKKTSKEPKQFSGVL